MHAAMGTSTGSASLPTFANEMVTGSALELLKFSRDGNSISHSVGPGVKAAQEYSVMTPPGSSPAIPGTSRNTILQSETKVRGSGGKITGNASFQPDDWLQQLSAQKSDLWAKINGSPGAAISALLDNTESTEKSQLYNNRMGRLFAPINTWSPGLRMPPPAIMTGLPHPSLNQLEQLFSPTEMLLTPHSAGTWPRDNIRSMTDSQRMNQARSNNLYSSMPPVQGSQAHNMLPLPHAPQMHDFMKVPLLSNPQMLPTAPASPKLPQKPTDDAAYFQNNNDHYKNPLDQVQEDFAKAQTMENNVLCAPLWAPFKQRATDSTNALHTVNLVPADNNAAASSNPEYIDPNIKLPPVATDSISVFGNELSVEQQWQQQQSAGLLDPAQIEKWTSKPIYPNWLRDSQAQFERYLAESGNNQLQQNADANFVDENNLQVELSAAESQKISKAMKKKAKKESRANSSRSKPKGISLKHDSRPSQTSSDMKPSSSQETVIQSNVSPGIIDSIISGPALASPEKSGRRRDEKMWPCRWPGCTAVFKRAEHHRRHQFIHTGARPHVCDVCGKSFGRKDNLQQHEKTHDIKPKRTEKPCRKRAAEVEEPPLHFLSPNTPMPMSMNMESPVNSDKLFSVHSDISNSEQMRGRVYLPLEDTMETEEEDILYGNGATAYPGLTGEDANIGF